MRKRAKMKLERDGKAILECRKFKIHTTTRAAHPLYKARMPSALYTWDTTRKGLRGVGMPFWLLSCTLVFANSNGYCIWVSDINLIGYHHGKDLLM